MYNADDAVARIDSYIVSVSGRRPVHRTAHAGADRAGVGAGRGAVAPCSAADGEPPAKSEPVEPASRRRTKATAGRGGACSP